MGEIIVLATAWLKAHIAVVITALLGAIFNALMSSESWHDRLIGSTAGFILAMVFAEQAAVVLANGKSPEIFGFILAVMGKDTVELALSTLRNVVKSKLKNEIEGK